MRTEQKPLPFGFFYKILKIMIASGHFCWGNRLPVFFSLAWMERAEAARPWAIPSTRLKTPRGLAILNQKSRILDGGNGTFALTNLYLPWWMWAAERAAPVTSGNDRHFHVTARLADILKCLLCLSVLQNYSSYATHHYIWLFNTFI